MEAAGDPASVWTVPSAGITVHSVSFFDFNRHGA
jgi:hypothetical protein